MKNKVYVTDYCLISYNDEFPPVYRDVYFPCRHWVCSVSVSCMHLSTMCVASCLRSSLTSSSALSQSLLLSSVSERLASARQPARSLRGPAAFTLSLTRATPRTTSRSLHPSLSISRPRGARSTLICKFLCFCSPVSRSLSVVIYLV